MVTQFIKIEIDTVPLYLIPHFTHSFVVAAKGSCAVES